SFWHRRDSLGEDKPVVNLTTAAALPPLPWPKHGWVWLIPQFPFCFRIRCAGTSTVTNRGIVARQILGREAVNLVSGPSGGIEGHAGERLRCPRRAVPVAEGEFHF